MTSKVCKGISDISDISDEKSCNSRENSIPFAENLPVIDICSHLSAEAIFENQPFSNITDLWLKTDPNKQSAMRLVGVEESYITGNASDYEKFDAFCKIMPLYIGNPLYAECHMQLSAFFDCDLPLVPENTERIWCETAKRLAAPQMGIRDLLMQSGIRLLCTLRDPIEAPPAMERAEQSTETLRVLPAWDPNRIFSLSLRGISAYLQKLGDTVGFPVVDCETLFAACTVMMDAFAKAGCRTAVHFFETPLTYLRPDPYHADLILRKALDRDGVGITEEEQALWNLHLLRFFGKYYTAHGWVMQLYRRYNTQNDSHLVPILSYLRSQSALPRILLNGFLPMDADRVFCVQNGCTCGLLRTAYIHNREDDTLFDPSAFAKREPIGLLAQPPSFAEDPLSLARHPAFRRNLRAYLQTLSPTVAPTLLADAYRRTCFDSLNHFFDFGLSCP